MSFKNNDGYKCCVYNAKNKTKVFQLFSCHLIEYIHESSEKQLLDFLRNPECLEVIQEFSYEVLEIIVMILNEEHGSDKKKINDLCEKSIVFLATHCSANELILYIVEQIDMGIIKPHYHILFHSLRLCLSRCRKPLKMLDMCVDTIKKFIKNLPLPIHKSSKDRNDEIMEQIVLSYVNLIYFIDNIYRDSISFDDTAWNGIAVDMKHCIFKLLISIFGDTFNCIDMSNENCNFIFQKALNILYSEIDLIYLIHLKHKIEIEKLAHCESNEHVEKDCLLKFNNYYPFINMNYVQLCNLCWVVFYSEKKYDHIPCIYNPMYIIFCILQLSNHVMYEIPNQNILMSRVLNLIDFAMNINKLPIPMEYIDSIVHDRFMQNMMNLVVSNDSIKIQKYVINSLIQYINKFEIKAKYRILQKLVTFKCHVKIIGIAIVIFKDTVAQSHFKEPIDEKERLFFDNSLQDVISKICCLKDDVNTDLIEISDQLIPTLNFVIFYIIRKKENNEIVQHFCKSNYKFVKLLGQLLKVQVGEWKRYLDYLEGDANENQHCIDNLQPSMTTMSVMPKNQQIFMCHQATNTLFIIDNLIHRICELTNYSIVENGEMIVEDCGIEPVPMQ